MKKTKLCELLNIKYPIIQGGMVWVSGGKLAAASSNSGCLGVIGAGSMSLKVLESQILKAKYLTKKPLAVNIPIMYERAKEQIDLSLSLGISIFITSAGSPKKFTPYLKEKNAIVLHVTSSLALAKKCERAGVDGVIVEGFEAGGHNGREELTSMVLIPQTVKALSIPIIAAGGFASGGSVLAAMALGAVGVQMGTRFMMTQESRAHKNFKELLLSSKENSTMLMMKKHIPVRLVKNNFYDEIKKLEDSGADKEELIMALGKGRAREGMHCGDIENGELEAGQVCSSIQSILTVEQMVEDLVLEYREALELLCQAQK